ncbi:MAG: Ig-like domain-containing protein [Oscillospiraceae bacterium]|nr:Ig-like domain-containing protein [Oscillospiraceae bacterium]
MAVFKFKGKIEDLADAALSGRPSEVLERSEETESAAEESETGLSEIRGELRELSSEDDPLSGIDLRPRIKATRIDRGRAPARPALVYRVDTEAALARPIVSYPRITMARSGAFFKLLPALAALLMLLLLSGAAYASYAEAIPPHIAEISVSNTVNEDNTVTVTVRPEGSWMIGGGDLWCLLSPDGEAPSAEDPRWVKAENGVCSFDVSDGRLHFFVKDKRGVISEPESEEYRIDRVLSVQLDRENIYLPLQGRQSLTAKTYTMGEASERLTWTSSDTSVARVTNGEVEAVGVGVAEITAASADGASDTVRAVVTDLITLPNWHTSEKRLLDYRYVERYTEEEAALLDEILFDRIEQAGGLGTRGGAVAAARFLTLEFPYKVAYFFENGRLNPHAGRPYADGEGRFYHRGLYLTESKFDLLDPEGIRYGPATWGSLLLNFETKYAFVGGVRYPNGLDCSGFVSWVLCNGGTIVGDLGAGDEYGDNDLCDLAELEWISSDYIRSDEPRVGDLIAEDGHMAIIMGMTDEEIWIAESLFTNVRVTHFTRGPAVRNSGLYTYVVPMDEVYESDGNVTEMWTELGWPWSEEVE